MPLHMACVPFPTFGSNVILDTVGETSFVISLGPPRPDNSMVLPDYGVVAELDRRGRALSSDINNNARGLNEANVEPDANESPGGCSSALLRFAPAG